VKLIFKNHFADVHKNVVFMFYASTNSRRQTNYVLRLYVWVSFCGYINTFLWCNISLLSGSISTKRPTNIHYTNGKMWNDCRGQRSEEKVIIRTAYYVHGPEVMKLIFAVLYVSHNDGPHTLL